MPEPQPPLSDRGINPEVGRSTYFKDLIKRAEGVVSPVRNWWEGLTVNRARRAGITLGLAIGVGISATLASSHGQRSEISAPPPTAQITNGGGLPPPTSTPERATPIPQPTRTNEQRVQQIEEHEDYYSKLPPEYQVDERETPLPAEEAAALKRDFSPITATIKEFIRPEALAKNPDLQFDEVANDAKKIDFYQRADLLIDASDEFGYQDKKRDPNDRVILFMPYSGRGSVAVLAYISSDGHVYRKDLSIQVNDQGIVTSQFLHPQVPEAKQEELLKLFYRLPDGAISWERDENNRLIGKLASNGRTFQVDISETGYSGVTIEEDQSGGSVLTSASTELTPGKGIKKAGEEELNTIEKDYPDLLELHDLFKDKFNAGIRASMDQTLFEMLKDGTKIDKQDGVTIYQSQSGARIEVSQNTRDNGSTDKSFNIRLFYGGASDRKDAQVTTITSRDGKLQSQRIAFFVYEDASSLSTQANSLEYPIVDQPQLQPAIETAFRFLPKGLRWQYLPAGTSDRPYPGQAILKAQARNNQGGIDTYQISQDGRVLVEFNGPPLPAK